MKTRSANRFLLLFFLCIGAFTTNAQYVTIPDTAFAHFLRVNYPACMNGNQMDTTCPGIVNATNLSCIQKRITDLTGIQYFDNLQHLNCSFNNPVNIPSLPSGLVELRARECFGNCTCAIVPMPALPSGLTTLEIGSNGFLYSLPPLPAGLQILGCDADGLSSLPPLPAGLISLNCDMNYITNFPASWPSTLQTLQCGSYRAVANFYPSVYTNFPPLPAGLTGFGSNGGIMPQQFKSQLTSLPQNLTSFECAYCGLDSLPALPSGLAALWVHFNNLTSIPSLPPDLVSLICHDNQLTTLPSLAGNNFYYGTLDISNNPITCLPPLPNNIYQFYLGNTQLTCLPNYPSVQYTDLAFNSLPLCDVYNPHGCYINWNIGGKTYFDKDNNCTFNGNDTELSNIIVQLWSGGIIVQQRSNAGGNGEFSFNTNMGTFQVSIDTAGLPFQILCPANNLRTSVISLADSLDDGLDFALKCKPGFDFEARSIVSGTFRPGGSTVVSITAGDAAQFYGASCVTGISGTVTTTIIGSATYVNAAAGARTPTSVNNNILTYNIADMGTVNIFKDFNVILHTDTTAQGGQSVCITVSVTPTAGDRNISNNTLTRCFPVVNSYDPNDKQVSPAGALDTTQEWLTYTIRFQNTGTAAAEHIHIDDTLDTDLDESTFQLLAYSHEPLVQLKLNAIRFNFPNINLPDSTANEPESHGYVQYKVKLKDHLTLGTEISNKAAIYFDFNAPVITNSVMNVISDSVTISGGIFSENATPVPSVTVNLSGSATASVVTGSDGLYIFTVPSAGDYTVTPAKSNDVTTNNGVSTFDITLVRRHILGSALASPYKLIAADVDESQTISVSDILLTRRVVLNNTATFSGKLWKFANSDYVFPDPLKPFTFENTRTYSNIYQNQTGQNFTGIKLGDVNNSWDPSIAKIGAVGEVQFSMEQYQVLPNDEIVVPVKVKDFNSIAGYQFTLAWDPEVLSFTAVENVSTAGYFGEQLIEEGMLTTSWNDINGRSVTLNDNEVVFQLKFNVTGNAGSSSEIAIGSAVTCSEAYTNALDLLNIVAAKGVVNVGDVSTGLPNDPSLYHLHVQPNPFTTSATIEFTVPRDETVSLTISDMLGRKVKLIRSEFSKGQHKLIWNGDDEQGNALPKGIYFIGLNSENAYLVTKVVMVK